MAQKRFRYTPKYPGCPSFTATFIRVETEGGYKGWTTFKKDGDDDHIYSMFFDDPEEIEWLDDDDNQTADTPTTPDKQSASATETTQPRPRKPRKRKEKPVSRTTDEQEQQPDNSLFSLLFILVVAVIVIGTIVFFPGIMVIAAIFGTGGAIARAEDY
jgi:hypothetical protein